MNYPIWDLPASGLLIAFVAIVHVFVAHFAVGGGLFLVVAEAKARRDQDDAMLAWVRRHSRFFILLTLVFGAITGVGIWFTIGLVHPAGTSTLINAFVWGWAIEWTFFFTEIAAAIVYYYGWDRLTPRQHLTIGWIYFGSAWASLLVINGILSFMLTPGAWVGDHSFWSGYFNPTFWPSLVIRTLGAVGLAGVYAILTASWMHWSDSVGSKEKLVRWSATRWALPMAIAMPFALLWYFSAAGAAGIPVGEIFGAASSRAGDLLAVIFTTATLSTGHPIAQNALRAAVASLLILIGLAAIVTFLRGRIAMRITSVLLMLAAFGAVGGAEWAREDLRKPFVIGSVMFVNGLRLPPPRGSEAAALAIDDPLQIDRIKTSGLLRSAKWVHDRGVTDPTLEQEALTGSEVFRLSCSQCHTIDGYLAIRPLVKGQAATTIEGLLPRLASPRGPHGELTGWSTAGVQVATWRNRRMPPFAGNDAEQRALSVYLAKLGGGAIAPRVQKVSGEAVFEAGCAMCHAADCEWPITPRVSGRSEADLYDMIGRLPTLNDMMPPFEGTEDERVALARHLATTGGTMGSTTGGAK